MGLIGEGWKNKVTELVEDPSYVYITKRVLLGKKVARQVPFDTGRSSRQARYVHQETLSISLNGT